MSSLYELTGEYLNLLAMLEDEDVDEQVIMDTIEGLDGEFEQKADNYAKIIRNLEGKNKAIENEIDRLNKRKTTFENRIKYLKNRLYEAMKLTGKTKFTTDLFSFNIQKNGGKRTLVVDMDIELIPEEYRIKQPDKINGDKIRELLKELGSDRCEFAHLEPQGESLRIK